MVSNYWNLGNSTFSTDVNPLASYSDSGRFTIILEVTNAEGCKDTFSLNTGLLYADFVLYLPNSFSPDGDGINDVFKLEGTKYNKEFLLEIYNQWGEKVFETNNMQDSWDGTYQGKECQQGVYLCIIHLIPMKDFVKSYRTNITLIR